MKRAPQNPKAVFLKIDVDDQKELAARYKITAMPTFVALKDKTQVDTMKCVWLDNARSYCYC